MDREGGVDLEAYHREQLRTLQEHVRSGLSQLDAGVIDEFAMDKLLYQYQRAATELWKFCNAPRAGLRARAESTISTGSGPDWWEAAAPTGRPDRRSAT